MKILIAFIFLLSFISVSSQTFAENQNQDLALRKIIDADDIYDNDLKIRIQYINDLNKIILINFMQVPDSLISSLSKVDVETVRKIFDIYSDQIKKMEYEFNFNQKVTYKSLTPKSRINNLLLIDELKNYPNSYSIFSTNQMLLFNNNDLNKNMRLIMAIYQKNIDLLLPIVTDVDSYRKQFSDTPLYYPRWANQAEIDFYNKINVVLWCYSNSGQYFNGLKIDSN